ncbi:Lysine 6-monooxygenase [Lasiodiplodia theobromae]|uniref:Lysine 6-monooxygenase n=1 Tax=Lasiodiplodia theobromae TaxID=45133 RepID=UPI0015C384D8|nr:Lysine 6-monooxygenase [Lasiodiplodia theobromae]KAF4546042.1 Lysine 6-monooxygenase [Lasiodiplodia theobromae]
MDSPKQILNQLPGGFEFRLQVINDGEFDNQWADDLRARKAAVVKANVLHRAFGSPVIRCFVASGFDGLLYAGSAMTETLKNKPFIVRKKTAERTEERTDQHTSGGYWIPFDVNSIDYPTPRTDSRTSPRDYTREENCQFIINMYDLATDTLILIPRPLIHLTTKPTQRPDHMMLASRIPPGLAHLAFPAYRLPEALENVRQAAISTGVYVNPHSGVKVPFKPKLFKLAEVNYRHISTTSPVPAVRGFSILSEAIEMSQKRGEGYYLDLNPCQPLGCDAIIRRFGKVEWAVEIKLRSNIEAGSSLVLHYDVDAMGCGDPTAPFGVWNFLMLYDQDEELCYWIPRDKMRLEWSPALLGCNGPGVIRIPKQDLADFRVNCHDSDWFSYVFDRIILPNKHVPCDTHPSLEQIAEARSNPNFDFVTPDKVDPDGVKEASKAMEVPGHGRSPVFNPAYPFR